MEGHMAEELTDMVTTAAAATALGVNDSRIRQLLRAGELAGVKIGRDWVISRQEIERFKKEREKQQQAE
jgi:excisionase family DNA binding protein